MDSLCRHIGRLELPQNSKISDQRLTMHAQYADTIPLSRLFRFPSRNLTPGLQTKRIGLGYKNTRYTEVVTCDILGRQGEQMTFYEANETQ